MPVTEIIWRSRHCHPHIWRNTNGNHVFGNSFSGTYTGIKTISYDVSQPIICKNFDFNIGVFFYETRHCWPEY